MIIIPLLSEINVHCIKRNIFFISIKKYIFLEKLLGEIPHFNTIQTIKNTSDFEKKDNIKNFNN